MADELQIEVGVKLNTDDIASQLESIKSNKDNKIDIGVNIEKAKNAISEFKKALGSGTPAKLVLDVLKGQSNTNIKTFVDSIQQQYQSKPIELTFGVDTRATQRNIDSALQGMQQSLQKQMQQAASQTNQQTQKQTSSKPFTVPDRSSKYQDDYGKLLRTTTISSVGKDDEGNKLVTPHTAIDQFKRDAGEMVTVVQKLTEAEEGEGKVWEEVSHTVTENLEARYREAEKINNYFAKQDTEFNKLYSSAFDQGNPLTGDFADKALIALDNYQSKYTEVMRSGGDVTEEQKREIEELRQVAMLAIKEQQSLQQQFNSEKKQDYSGLFGQSKEWEATLKNITDAENKLNEIKKNAFSGTNALTGDFAKEATSQIDAVKSKFAEIRKVAEESFGGATTVSKEEMSKMLKDLESDLNRLAKLEYPSDKLAAQSVDVKKAFAADALTDMEDKLKNLGEGTTDFYNRVQDLKTLLSSVGKVDSDPTAWAEFRNKFHLLEDDIKKFENSAQGMGQKLASGIETNQLQQIADMVDRLNNIDEKYSGEGVERLQQNLSSLAVEYQNVMAQLQAPDLTQEQFDALAQKVKELGEQLKQAQNAAKIFNDGFKNDTDLKKYEQNADGVRMKFEQLQRTYEKLAQSNPQIAQRFEDVKQKIDDMDPGNIKLVSGEVNNLAKECANAQGQSAGLRGALQDAFGGLGSYISRFASSYFIITKLIQGVKSMVNSVKEVDSSLVELQKVTTLSGNSLQQFTKQAYEAGRGLGRTGKDVIDAVTTFSRAGYDLQEATDLAKSALVMSNVGVDIPNMESAASDMISILKAFDIQAQDSMAVIDKLYNVANKEPLDFGNITEMLVTSGGTLAQTGTSLEETMALLTGAFATLRDESVANG